jgi:CBS domain-containing protein
MTMERELDRGAWAGHEATTSGGWTPGYFWLAVGAAAAALPLAVAWRRPGAGRRVRDVMVRDVVTIDASATMRDAAERMRETNVGVLPVMEWGQVRGVVTDRDLVVRGLARGADPTTTRVAECMTGRVVCAGPDWKVDDARAVMAECQIGRLPVVDDRNRLLGIVTLGSLALRARDEEETLQAAREVSRRSARA